MMQREVMLNARRLSGHTLEQVAECDDSVNKRNLFERLMFWKNVLDNPSFPKKTRKKLLKDHDVPVDRDV